VNNSIVEICKKYKDKVFVVDFPYGPFEGHHWNSIQRISLHIGVNAFRKKCKWIALIDADEFIRVNEDKKINRFLESYSCSITMQSNILTNKNNDDIINNNVLKLALYVGENKYLKTILNTDKINEYEFIFTPHNHPTAIILDKSIIMHFHCWMNKRCTYNDNMTTIDIFCNNMDLSPFFCLE
jgi:hypothetical protein